MYECEYCKSNHDGSYGSGRFCSATCARKYSNTFVSEIGRANQIKVLNDEETRKKIHLAKSNTKSSKSKKQYRQNLRPKFNHSLTLGKVGELEVSKKFLEHGYRVYTPLTDNGDGIDLVVSNGDGFKTVQVKSSASSKINNDGTCETTSFKVCKNIRHIHRGTYEQKSEKYSPDKVNYIALYSAYDGESYLIENNNDLSIGITIRNKYNNGQKKKIRYADDYQIDKVLDEINLIPGVYYDDEYQKII